MSRHISVKLFTFDNHPPQHLLNYYQIWVGGLKTGRGHYVLKPHGKEEDERMRLMFTLEDYKYSQINEIMNFIYKKL